MGPLKKLWKRQILAFSLIEVMVALVIISVGSLGYVKSQTTAVKSVIDIQTQTYAEILVNSMVNKIMANASHSAVSWSGYTYYTYATNSTYPWIPLSSYWNTCFRAGAPSCPDYYEAIAEASEWYQLIRDTNIFPASSAAIGRICRGNAPASLDFSNLNCPSDVITNPVTYNVRIYWKSVGSSSYDQGVMATAVIPLDKLRGGW